MRSKLRAVDAGQLLAYIGAIAATPAAQQGNTMRALLLALIATSAGAFEAPEVVGVHMVSTHERSGRNNQNPGAFAVWSGGETVGVYRNSHRTWSAYAGQKWSTDQRAPVIASVTLGGVAGYPMAPVLPLIVGTVTLRVTDKASVSLSAMPKPKADGVAVIHMTAEWRL